MDEQLHPGVRERLDVLVAKNTLPLPVLPAAAASLISILERPRCELRDVADVIHRDPTLTAHVLRIAGSPAYAAATKIVSLPQVIGRLGFAAIMQIALVVASRTRVFKVPGFEAEVKSSFQHSFTTALYAQEIARLRRGAVDQAFIAGLLHDIGRPVVLQVLVDLHAEVGAASCSVALIAAASERHAEIGGSLVDSWALPAKVAEAVRMHHSPDGIDLAMVVALADSFSHGAPDAAAAMALHLYPEDLALIASKAEVILQTVEVMA
ncbi:MAG: HDOD domain-containing protein [Kofleriaceae bacterium]